MGIPSQDPHIRHLLRGKGRQERTLKFPSLKPLPPAKVSHGVNGTLGCLLAPSAHPVNEVGLTLIVLAQKAAFWSRDEREARSRVASALSILALSYVPIHLAILVSDGSQASAQEPSEGEESRLRVGSLWVHVPNPLLPSGRSFSC